MMAGTRKGLAERERLPCARSHHRRGAAGGMGGGFEWPRNVIPGPEPREARGGTPGSITPVCVYGFRALSLRFASASPRSDAAYDWNLENTDLGGEDAMKITDVRVHALEARLSQPFSYARAW